VSFLNRADSVIREHYYILNDSFPIGLKKKFHLEADYAGPAATCDWKVETATSYK
jgi:hypothetical protein